MCGMKTNNRQSPEWWVTLPETEKTVLRTFMHSIRAMEECTSPQIASAARKWDATLSCFIKTRLINRKVRLSRAQVRSAGAGSTSFRTGGRNRPGASPNQN
jgi:hypothetical protein